MFSVMVTSAGADTADDRALSAQIVQQVEHWQELARKGDANAMFNLGQYFRRGIGIEPDLQQAQAYYQQAAELGHVGAQLNLGTLYYFAPDKPNLTKVEYWWDKAARQGDPSAQYQLAILYLKLPEPRPLDALGWMTLAQRNGDPQADKALVKLKSSLPAAVQAGLEERLAQLQPEQKEPELLPADTQGLVAKPALDVDATPSTGKVEPPTEPPSVIEPDRATATVTNTVPDAGGRYTVQLASLSSQASAQTLAETLAQRYAAVLAGQPVRVQAVRRSADVLFRIQAGLFADRDQARDLCEQLKSAGQPCFPAAR